MLQIPLLLEEIVKEIKQLGYNPIHSYRVDSKICDVYIPSLNLIIEYFGDYWHCNPAKFSKDYFNPTTQRYAHDQWERDNRKKQVAEAEGYAVIIVWESDFNKNILTGHKEITRLCI